jgi:hypothetical protein
MKRWLMLIAISLLIVTGNSFPQTSPAYFAETGHWYQVVSSGSMTWTQARDAATALGGYLACISSQEENDFILGLAPPQPATWIGGTDQATEGDWQWISGESWSFSHWGSGEPNSGGGMVEEDYLEMWTSDNHASLDPGDWNDDGVSQPSFIVEFNSDLSGDLYWSPVGTGMNDRVVAFTIDAADRLVAGGHFTEADGLAARKIALWDGLSWSAMGEGMNDEIPTLTTYLGNVIAGGEFDSAGGATAKYIAEWNGSVWSPLGSGFGGCCVEGMTVFNGNLVAGGYFITAGDTMNRVALWDGSSWTAFGSGTDSMVEAVAVYDSKLIAGGWFTQAGGSPASRIAQWDGSTWSPLGDGVTDAVGGQLYIDALVVFRNRLIAAGTFLKAGGGTVNHIAQWDGSAWSPLGQGTNARVHTLAVHNGMLFVGGDFTEASGVPARHIAC